MNSTATGVTDGQSLLCADFELSAPVLPQPDGRALCLLVRLHGDPFGEVVVSSEAAAGGVDAVTGIAVARFSQQLSEHLSSDRLGDLPIASALRADVECARVLRPQPPLPSITVIVCTLGKHPLLRSCLEHLLDQDFEGDYEILVVDNAPATGATQAVLDSIGDDRLRYVAAPVKGVSNARTAGARAATGDVLLYTDDDALADRGWVRGNVAVFAESPKVTAVTGLVMAGSLATRAEQWFEQACGFNKGYSRFVWSLAPAGDPIYQLGPKGDGGPLFPFSAGHFGSGNCMAVRRDVLLALDGFDPALTTGEDLDVFCRVILSGGVLVYEPRILVRHFHRETYDALVAQMRSYGVGLSAFLTKQMLHTPGARTRLLRIVPQGAKLYVQTRRSAGNVDETDPDASIPADYPKDLSRTEFAGFLRGPWEYLRARHRVKAQARATRKAAGLSAS